MSKNILVSTDVFAAIWASRQHGEESEDAVLRRILGCKPLGDCDDNLYKSNIGGVYDHRNEIEFPQGFGIFRKYKGKLYKAQAIDGAWQREDTADRYPTLNQLNSSIVAGNENVWNGNWKYRDENGTICSLDYIRKHKTVKLQEAASGELPLTGLK